jgi:hypothetical protein
MIKHGLGCILGAFFQNHLVTLIRRSSFCISENFSSVEIFNQCGVDCELKMICQSSSANPDNKDHCGSLDAYKVL